MELTCFNPSLSQDYVELSGEVVYRAASIFHRPITLLPSCLDVLISERGNENIRETIRLFRLVLCEKIQEIFSEG